jgi:hypothetical protein
VAAQKGKQTVDSTAGKVEQGADDFQRGYQKVRGQPAYGACILALACIHITFCQEAAVTTCRTMRTSDHTISWSCAVLGAASIQLITIAY